MNIPETQKDVLVYLDGLTRELGNCKLDQFTTASIASSLVISRNLASQYLNGLVRADLAVKAGGKPVYYFHRRSLERYLQTPVSRNVYSSIDELFERAGADSSASFESVVGWDLSLSECVQRLRSAMVYPPQGIPVLLAGARGTGKTLLSRAAFDYAVSEGILSASSHRVIIDCSRLRDGVVDMQNDICSAIDASCTGTSSSKFNGMIFFRNVEELSMQARDAVLSKFAPESTQGESTERISAFLNRQIGTIRAVFSTSCDPSSLEMKELSRHFPLVVNVPGLRDRTPEERSELCLRFLKEEGRRIGVDVFISKSAFRRLSDAEYDEEVRGMRACVTSCCASAFLDHKGDRIDI